MQKIGSFLVIGLLSLIFTGCAEINPLSPELNNKINNQQGQIEELKNIQNGLNVEVGKQRNELDLQNNKLKDLQQGLFNLKLSSNENSGIQILQGDGALILVFSVIVIVTIFVYQYMMIRRNAKTADLLANQIVLNNDENALEEVFRACMYTDVETDVYDLITKHQNNVKV